MIEFVKYVSGYSIRKAESKPADFKNIELVCKSYHDGYDVMFAYNRYKDEGGLYLGYYNDGKK